MSQPSYRRRLSVGPLAGVERQGRGSLGSGGLAVGISLSLPSDPHLIQGTHPFSGVLSQFHQGQGFGRRGAFSSGERSRITGSPPSPGFYSRLIVVMKASGSWRPVIDLSLLNLKVLKTSFKMETLQSVLLSVQPGDSMVSLDLKDGYLQVPMHPKSRKFLRFVAFGKVYQFMVLCFGLSTAPQVFTQVMAPVSAFLHRSGIQIHRYLDDWLIQASSREQVLLALESVLRLCQALGIVVNWEKSQLVPSQHVEYLGVLLDSDFQGFSCPKESREASLNWRRVLVLRATACCLLAGAAGGSGFTDSAYSRGEALDAVSAVLFQEVLGLFPTSPCWYGGSIRLGWR